MFAVMYKRLFLSTTRQLFMYKASVLVTGESEAQALIDSMANREQNDEVAYSLIGVGTASEQQMKEHGFNPSQIEKMGHQHTCLRSEPFDIELREVDLSELDESEATIFRPIMKKVA